MPRDKVIISFFGIGLVLIIISALMIGFMIPKESGQLILHFDPEHNISFIGGKVMVLSVIALIAVVGLINLFIAREVYYRERFLSYLIAFVTLIISILCLIASGVIVAIN